MLGCHFSKVWRGYVGIVGLGKSEQLMGCFLKSEESKGCFLKAEESIGCFLKSEESKGCFLKAEESILCGKTGVAQI